MVAILNFAAIGAAVVGAVQAAPPNTYSKISTSVSPHYPHYSTTATSTYPTTKATWTPYSRKPTVGSYVSTTKSYTSSTSQYYSSSSTKVHHSLPYSTPTVKPSYNSSTDFSSLFGPFNNTRCGKLFSWAEDAAIPMALEIVKADLHYTTKKISLLREGKLITRWQERHIKSRAREISRFVSELEKRWYRLAREAKTCSARSTKAFSDRLEVLYLELIIDVSTVIDVPKVELLQEELETMVMLTSESNGGADPKHYYPGKDRAQARAKIAELVKGGEVNLTQTDHRAPLPNKNVFTKGVCENLSDKIGDMVNKVPVVNSIQFQNVNLAQWIQVFEIQCVQQVDGAPAAVGELLNATGTVENEKTNLTRRDTTTGGGLIQSFGKLSWDLRVLCLQVDHFLKEIQTDLLHQTPEAKRLSYELRKKCDEVKTDADGAEKDLGWKQVFDQMMEAWDQELCGKYGHCDDEDEEEKPYYRSNSTMPEKRVPAKSEMFTDEICQSLGNVLAKMTKKVPGMDGIKFYGMDISQLMEVVGAQCDQKLGGSSLFSTKSSYETQPTSTYTPYSHKPSTSSYVSTTTTGSYPHKTFTHSKPTGSYRTHKTHKPAKTTDTYRKSTTAIPPHMARGATSTGPNGEVYGIWTTTIPYSKYDSPTLSWKPQPEDLATMTTTATLATATTTTS